MQRGGLMEFRGTAASVHLDMMRGLAALTVLFYHLRYLFLQNATPKSHADLISRILYVASNCGHPAVVMFFVLSGWLIAGNILRNERTNSWDWRDYLLRRSVRLYVVLLPALLLTWFWDRLTLMAALHRTANTSTGVAIISIPILVQHSTPQALLSSLFFLQRILAPAYGSDKPLWSLAHEGWYYLIFPCLWFACAGKSLGWRRRILLLASGVLMLAFVGAYIALYFSLWLVGAALCFAPRLPLLLQTRPRQIATVVAGLLLLAVLVLRGMGRLHDGYGADAATALAFAALLYVALHDLRATVSAPYRRLAHALAGSSYTLYLVHVPPLIWLRTCLTYTTAWPPDAKHWLALGAIFAAIWIYAYLLSRLTEANTDAIRDAIKKRLVKPGGMR